MKLNAQVQSTRAYQAPSSLTQDHFHSQQKMHLLLAQTAKGKKKFSVFEVPWGKIGFFGAKKSGMLA